MWHSLCERGTLTVAVSIPPFVGKGSDKARDEELETMGFVKMPKKLRNLNPIECLVVLVLDDEPDKGDVMKVLYIISDPIVC